MDTELQQTQYSESSESSDSNESLALSSLNDDMIKADEGSEMGETGEIMEVDEVGEVVEVDEGTEVDEVVPEVVETNGGVENEIVFPFATTQEEIKEVMENERRVFEMNKIKKDIERQHSKNIVNNSNRHRNFLYLDQIWLMDMNNHSNRHFNGGESFDDVVAIRIESYSGMPIQFNTTSTNNYVFTVTYDNAHHILENLKIPIMTSNSLVGSYLCDNYRLPNLGKTFFYQDKWDFHISIYTNNNIYIADGWNGQYWSLEEYDYIGRPIFKRISRNPF